MITIARSTRLRLASQPSGIDSTKLATIGMIASRTWLRVSSPDQVEVVQRPVHPVCSPGPSDDARGSPSSRTPTGRPSPSTTRVSPPSSASLLQVEVPLALVGTDEAGHEVVGRVGEDLGRGARLGDHPALAEDHHLVREDEGLVDVVGDEDDRLAQLALQPVQLDLQVGPDDRVDGPERLVHQQDVGVAGQRAGNADALLLPTRELAGIAAGPAPRSSPTLSSSSRASSRAARLRHAVEDRHGGDVVDHLAVRQQPGGLQDVADAPAQLHLVLRGDVDAVDQHLPRRWARPCG